MALTDLAIRNLKPSEKPFKASDSGGLHLLVNPNGSRLWRLKYRYEGKEKLLALGAYPIVTLAKARQKRDEAKAQLADGIDPAKSRRESRIAAVATSGNTFRLVAEEYLDKLRREGRAPATLAKVEWLLSFAYGDLGERPISEIAAAEVLAVLRKVEQRGRRESARRLRSTVGSVFRYAIATARAENDPTFALHAALVAPKVKHRAAPIGTAQFGLHEPRRHCPRLPRRRLNTAE